MACLTHQRQLNKGRPGRSTPVCEVTGLGQAGAETGPVGPWCCQGTAVHPAQVCQCLLFCSGTRKPSGKRILPGTVLFWRLLHVNLGDPVITHWEACVLPRGAVRACFPRPPGGGVLRVQGAQGVGVAGVVGVASVVGVVGAVVVVGAVGVASVRPATLPQPPEVTRRLSAECEPSSVLGSIGGLTSCHCEINCSKCPPAVSGSGPDSLLPLSPGPEFRCPRALPSPPSYLWLQDAGLWPQPLDTGGGGSLFCCLPFGFLCSTLIG